MFRTMVLRVIATVGLAFIVTVPLANAQGGDMDVEMIIEELTDALELSDEQAQEVMGHLQGIGMAMAAVSEQAEAEETDKSETISALKAARSEFRDNMKGTLSDEQYAAFDQLMDEVFQEIFESIAELKITDLKAPLKLTDDQAAALKPVMGTGIRDLIGVIFEYGDRRMGVRVKLQMANKLKAISAEVKAGMGEILTPEQMQQYEAMKEAQKEAKGSG